MEISTEEEVGSFIARIQKGGYGGLNILGYVESSKQIKQKEIQDGFIIFYHKIWNHLTAETKLQGLAGIQL